MKSLKVFFALVLVSMIGLTTWASLEKNVTFGYVYLCSERWGIATLGDATFAFLTFYAWVFYKERSVVSRIVWFILIMSFGNVAMAIYALNEIRKLPTDASIETFLLARTH